MANNAVIFNGALAGAIGGIQQRWLTSQQASDYNVIRNAAVAFADAIDTLIPASASIGAPQGNLIQTIASGVLAQRYLRESDSYADIARSIVALYTSVAAQLQPVSVAGLVSADVTIAVPAGGTTPGVLPTYVDTSLVGTVFDPIPANTPIVLNFQNDLNTANANNGGAVNYRISALNTLRILYFQRMIAGNYVATLTRLTQ